MLIGFFIEDYDFVVIGGGFGGLVCVKVGMDSSIMIYIFFFYVFYMSMKLFRLVDYVI